MKDRLNQVKVEAKAKVEAKENPIFSCELPSYCALLPNTWDYDTIISAFETVCLVSFTS